MLFYLSNILLGVAVLDTAECPISAEVWILGYDNKINSSSTSISYLIYTSALSIIKS